MQKLKSFWYVFTNVVTCVSIGSAVYIKIFFEEGSLDGNIIWQILFSSFLCSVWCVLYPQRELSKKGLLVAYLIHYTLVNLVVLGCGLWFEWFHTNNLPQVIGMLVMIAVIFAVVAVMSTQREAQMAELMNRRLKEYQEKHEGI